MVELRRSSAKSLPAATPHFERALELDPGYALAYCGLSNVYSYMAATERVGSKEAYQKAEHYASRALELDETLAEAHVALSTLLMNTYDFKRAEAELRRAIELNPSLAEAYFTLPFLLILRGRRDDCAEAIEQMLRLDPLSLQSSFWAGTYYFLIGERDKGIEHLKDAVELDQSASVALNNLGIAKVYKGLVEEGLRDMEKAHEKGGNFFPELAYGYVRAGRPEKARMLLEDALKPGGHGHVPSSFVAGAYAVLGEKDKALDWLERAYEERAAYLSWTKIDPDYESLWGEPRFKAILRKMGLEGD
jgi:tetratricopeptide (TPR) repeat protein